MNDPKMKRRDFLKATLATGLLALIPFTLAEETITIVDFKLQDGWFEKAIDLKFGERLAESIQVEMSVDQDILWQHVKLVDDRGNLWSTDDRGTTWTSGTRSFSVDRDRVTTWMDEDEMIT